MLKLRLGENTLKLKALKPIGQPGHIHNKHQSQCFLEFSQWNATLTIEGTFSEPHPSSWAEWTKSKGLLKLLAAYSDTHQ